MSLQDNNRMFNVNPTLIKRTALATLTTIALGTSTITVSAQSMRHSNQSADPRGYLPDSRHVDRYCMTPNGAEIWAGFAGPDERVDVITGEPCMR